MKISLTKTDKKKQTQAGASQRTWALGFLTFAVFVWVFYTYIMVRLPMGFKPLSKIGFLRPLLMKRWSG